MRCWYCVGIIFLSLWDKMKFNKIKDERCFNILLLKYGIFFLINLWIFFERYIFFCFDCSNKSLVRNKWNIVYSYLDICIFGILVLCLLIVG